MVRVMYGRLFRNLFTISVLSFVSTEASALDVVLEAGAHVGGDVIATGVFTSGDTRDIRAGQLLSLTAGMAGDLGDDLEARLSIGFKFDVISAANGEVTFDRVPVEALLFYKGRDGWLLGGGLTYHMSPELVSRDIYPGVNIQFDDAFGVVAAVDYLFPNGVYAGGRLTLIEYETLRGVQVNGNSLGAVLGIRF